MSSSSCTVCGSRETKVVDGLMYCEICGTQIFDFREVEADEDQGVTGIGKIRTKKVKEVLDKTSGKTDFVAAGLSTAAQSSKRKGENLRFFSQPLNTGEAHSEKFSRIAKDITTGREHAPAYLRCVGFKLAAFTKMLAKGTAWIGRDPAIPEGFANHTLAIYQRYLSVCNVAFTSNDYTDDQEKMFRAVVINTNLAFEKAREKKTKQERRKRLGKEKLQKSMTAWDLLVGDTLDENLNLRSDDEELDDENGEGSTAPGALNKSQMITIVDTTIPKETLENARFLYLGMDVVVAILYVSLITIGCRWILLSDIVRWIREDRMGINLFQRSSLDYGTVEGSKRIKSHGFSKLDLPLSEFQRTAFFTWQLCQIPHTPIKIDFKQIVARLLYNINLPEAMMERVFVLMDVAPPCRLLDDASLRRQGRAEQGPYMHGFNDGYTKILRFSCMVLAFGRRKRSRNSTNTDIFFSTETKALAYILMALKLSYGLDDEREVDISKRTKGLNGNTFDFMDWFYQLKMRMMLWEGYDPQDILQSWKPVQPLFYENQFPRGDSRSLYVYTGEHDNITKYFIKRHPRDGNFTHSVPRTVKIDSSASMPNPFSEDIFDVQTNRCSDESLYVPLRNQTNLLQTFLMKSRTEAEKQRMRLMVDENTEEVFKADYEKYELSKDLLPDTSDDNDAGAAWRSHFPCANVYKRYPRPNWTNAGFVHLKEKDERLKRLNKKMGLNSRDSGLRMVFASRKAAVDAWHTARTEMSQSFSALVSLFSQIIGESQEILYAAFLMLELQLVDWERFEQLKHNIVGGISYPIETTTLHMDGHRSYKTQYVSSAENISEAHEADIVHIGVPRNFDDGIGLVNLTADIEEDCAAYSSDDTVSSDSISGSDDSSDEESVAKGIGEEGRNGQPSALDPADPASSNPQRKRERQHPQRDMLSYDFDTVWMLVTMRYW